MNHTSTQLFISYRRGDEQLLTERFRDHLIERYGRENVFIDFDSIPPFVDFEQYIRQKIPSVDALIVIIGPQWVQLLQERQNQEEIDYVKLEIELGIASGIPLFPICLNHNNIPSKEQLPEVLHPLLRRNIPDLTSGRHFLDNIKRLLQSLDDEIVSQTGKQTSVADNSASSLSQSQENAFNVTINVILPNQIPSDDETKAFALFYKAAEQWGLKNFSEAIDLCSEAIEILPNFAWAFNSRGAARKASGDYEGAFKDYGKALELNPEFAEAFYNIGIAYHQLRKFDQAIDSFSNAIKISPNGDIYARRAMSRYRKGEWQLALGDYDMSIEIDPKEWMNYNNRGILYFDKADYVRAKGDYSKALELVEDQFNKPPEICLIHYNLARVLLETKDFKDALQYTVDALRLDPEFSDAYDIQSQIYLALGNLEQAEKCLDNAIKYSEDTYLPKYNNNRGWINFLRHKNENAILDLDNAITMDPTFAEAYNNRGIVKNAIQEFDGAYLDFTLAIELGHPRLDWVYSNRSTASLGMKNHSAALDDCDKSISLNKNYPNVYGNRADIVVNLMQYHNAIKDFERYIDLIDNENDPNFQSVKDTIAHLKTLID